MFLVEKPEKYGMMSFTYKPHLAAESYFKYFASSYYYKFSSSQENDQTVSYYGYYYAGTNTNFTWLFIKTGEGFFLFVFIDYYYFVAFFCFSRPQGFGEKGERVSDYVEILSLSFDLDSSSVGGVDIKKCVAGFSCAWVNICYLYYGF
jgi:hypothetical protein